MTGHATDSWIPSVSISDLFSTSVRTLVNINPTDVNPSVRSVPPIHSDSFVVGGARTPNIDNLEENLSLSDKLHSVHERLVQASPASRLSLPTPVHRELHRRAVGKQRTDALLGRATSAGVEEMCITPPPDYFGTMNTSSSLGSLPNVGHPFPSSLGGEERALRCSLTLASCSGTGQQTTSASHHDRAGLAQVS